MTKNEKTENKRYIIEQIFQISILIIFLGLFLYIISGFIFVILLALAISITTYPLFTKLLKIVRYRSIGSILMLILLTILVLFPLYFTGVVLYQQTVEIIELRYEILENDVLINCDYQICSIIFEHLETLVDSFNVLIDNLAVNLNFYLYSILTSVPFFIAQIFIFYITLFFFFLDKDKFLKAIKDNIPIEPYNKEVLFFKFKVTCRAVFVNSLFIALIQGILVGFGFYLFGIPGSVMWGLIAALLGLIPMVGASIIWIPAGIILILLGDIIRGIGLLIYGTLFIATSDSLLRPILLERSIHVHPFLILLSIIGGIQMFGFVGIFYGPIIISTLVAFIELYKFKYE